MIDVGACILLMFAQPPAVPVVVGAPAAVRFHLEDTTSHIVVDVVCPKSASACQRMRVFQRERLADDLPWVSLAPLVDDVAGSPLMDAAANEAKTKRWQLQIGTRTNASATAPVDTNDSDALLEVLALDVPARRPHPSADVSVVRFGGDPAARHDEARVHCEVDAIWCSLEHLPAWHAGPMRSVRWPHIAWMGEATNVLMTADHFVLEPGEPNQIRWSWQIRIDTRINASGPLAELTADAYGMLYGLVRGR